MNQDLHTGVLTGHPVVDAIAHIKFEGDITPRSWYKHICYQTKSGEKKADRLAIDILADIVYWYRPYQQRDELTGEEIGWKKKFKEDLLRRSPDAFAESLNASSRCVRESMRLLEGLGLIKVVLQPIQTAYGVLPNVMHIDICPEALAAITYRTVSNQNAETLEKSLLTKWVTCNDETSNKELRNRQQGTTKSVTTSYETINLSIYRDFIEINTEISHNAPLASPPAPPTQGCMCENEELVLTMKQPDLEELTPQLSALLLKNSESSQQTDNPSSGLNIPVGSFEKIEQANNELVVPSSEIANPTSRPHLTCYTMHPTEKTEQAMQKTGLPPWMDRSGPNGWKAEFVESYRQYLNSTPRYAKELIRQATTGEAKNALTRLSKTDSGTAEIQNHWDSFNELKERQQHQQSKQPHHHSDDALAKAIAADEERRRFEQQRHSWVPMPQNLAVDLKAKLQAAVDAKKVRPNFPKSTSNLREVEAQLKLALGA